MQSAERDVQTAVVADVLAEGQLAVHLHAGEHLKLAEALNQHLGTLVEVGLVGPCPPVALVACLVKLASLVVEAVAHLVTDHGTYAAIVYSIVGLRIEERWLQDGSGEADLVGRGVIVGVDGLRCHLPLALVHGLAHLAGEIIGGLVA